MIQLRNANCGLRNTPNSELKTTNSRRVATCIGCGCTDNQACLPLVGDPCHWLAVDYNAGDGVCSECEHKLDEYKRMIEARGIVLSRGQIAAIIAVKCEQMNLDITSLEDSRVAAIMELAAASRFKSKDLVHSFFDEALARFATRSEKSRQEATV